MTSSREQDPHNAVVRIKKVPCGNDPSGPADCGADLFFYERVADGVLRYEYVDVFCIPERSQLSAAAPPRAAARFSHPALLKPTTPSSPPSLYRSLCPLLLLYRRGPGRALSHSHRAPPRPCAPHATRPARGARTRCAACKDAAPPP